MYLCANSAVAQDISVDTVSTLDSSGIAEEDTGAVKTDKKKGEIQDSVRYRAEEIEYNMQKRTLFLRNNAEVYYQKVQLFADTITYFIDQNLFTARGNPLLIEGKDSTVGTFLTYNIQTKRGSISYATTHLKDGYFTGQRIVKSDSNHLYIEHGDHTSCVFLEEPHYYFYGRHIKVLPGDKAVSRPVVLNIGQAPVAVFPYFILPLEQDRSSGWLRPGWGGNVSSGGFIDNIGYYWAPNDYIDFQIAGKIREFQEFTVNAETNYRLRYWINQGYLRVNYALNSAFRRQRQDWTINYRHDQNLTPDGNFKLAGSGQLMSSKDESEQYNYYQAYSTDIRDILRKKISADMALTKRFTKINASASLSVRRDQDLVTQHIQDLFPSLSFSLPNRPLIPQKESEDYSYSSTGEEPEAKWYNKIYYGYNAKAIVKRDYYDKDTTEPNLTHKGMTQNLSVSMNHDLFKYIRISPNFNVTVSNFDRYRDTVPNYYDTLYDYKYDTLEQIPDSTDPIFDERGWVYNENEDIDSIITRIRDNDDTTYNYIIRQRSERGIEEPVYRDYNDYAVDHYLSTGVTMSTKLYGTFPIKILNFAGMRHTLSPSVAYTFTPRHDQEKQFYNFGIPWKRGTKKESQQVRFSLNNDFQGKIMEKPRRAGDEPRPKTFHMLSAGASASYNFAADSLKWSDLSVNASTRFKFANISYSTAFWLYDAGNNLSVPIQKSYSLRISPNRFSASGSLWGGDRLVLENAAPDTLPEFANAGMQNWSISLSPSYSLSASRSRQSDIMVPTKRFDLGANASINFTRNWAMSWSGRFDFVQNKFEDHSLNFSCDLECWDLRFTWRPSGLDAGYYHFKLNIKKYPEFKWEEKQR